MIVQMEQAKSLMSHIYCLDCIYSKYIGIKLILKVINPFLAGQYGMT